MRIVNLSMSLGPVSSVAVSQDGKFIFSGSQDRSIKVFDNKTKKQVHHFIDAHKGNELFRKISL